MLFLFASLVKGRWHREAMTEGFNKSLPYQGRWHFRKEMTEGSYRKTKTPHIFRCAVLFYYTFAFSFFFSIMYQGRYIAAQTTASKTGSPRK